MELELGLLFALTDDMLDFVNKVFLISVWFYLWEGRLVDKLGWLRRILKKRLCVGIECGEVEKWL